MSESSCDIVVIGSGPACLMAAWELRDSSPLHIDQSHRLGGRHSLLTRGDTWLNLGARIDPAPGSVHARPDEVLRARDRPHCQHHVCCLWLGNQRATA